MEFEDSRFALFPEPNAYIQKFDKEIKQKEIKKIVFQEPYETLPNYYINNNFTKHDCDCVSKSKHDNHYNSNYENQNNNQWNNGCNSNCNHGFNNENHCCEGKTYNNHGDNYNQHNSNKQNGFGFDIKKLLPLFSLFNKSGGADLSSLVGMLNNSGNSQNTNSSPMNLISTLISNKDAMSGILNMFKGGGLNLFGKKQTVKKELKTTDFEIKNYTRVQ